MNDYKNKQIAKAIQRDIKRALYPAIKEFREKSPDGDPASFLEDFFKQYVESIKEKANSAVS